MSSARFRCTLVPGFGLTEVSSELIWDHGRRLRPYAGFVDPFNFQRVDRAPATVIP